MLNDSCLFTDSKKVINLTLQDNILLEMKYRIVKRTKPPRASPIELIDRLREHFSVVPSMNLHHRSFPTLQDPDRRRMRRGARRAE